jgi:hypothetical protein
MSIGLPFYGHVPSLYLALKVAKIDSAKAAGPFAPKEIV